MVRELDPIRGTEDKRSCVPELRPGAAKQIIKIINLLKKQSAKDSKLSIIEERHEC